MNLTKIFKGIEDRILPGLWELIGTKMIEIIATYKIPKYMLLIYLYYSIT